MISEYEADSARQEYKETDSMMWRRRVSINGESMKLVCDDWSGRVRDTDDDVDEESPSLKEGGVCETGRRCFSAVNWAVVYSGPWLWDTQYTKKVSHFLSSGFKKLPRRPPTTVEVFGQTNKLQHRPVFSPHLSGLSIPSPEVKQEWQLIVHWEPWLSSSSPWKKSLSKDSGSSWPTTTTSLSGKLLSLVLRLLFTKEVISR